MGYYQAGRLAQLRGMELLEKAMCQRDVNGLELGVLARTSRQTISQLRTGVRLRTKQKTARNIESALRVKAGDLFIYDGMNE